MSDKLGQGRTGKEKEREKMCVHMCACVCGGVGMRLDLEEGKRKKILKNRS